MVVVLVILSVSGISNIHGDIPHIATTAFIAASPSLTASSVMIVIVIVIPSILWCWGDRAVVSMVAVTTTTHTQRNDLGYVLDQTDWYYSWGPGVLLHVRWYNNDDYSNHVNVPRTWDVPCISLSKKNQGEKENASRNEWLWIKAQNTVYCSFHCDWFLCFILPHWLCLEFFLFRDRRLCS